MAHASDLKVRPTTAAPSFNEKMLFWASFFTLIAAGIGFSIRGAILSDWSREFGFTQGELGGITGGGLVGFGITIIFFSFLADRVGYGILMVVAFLLHTSSAVVTLAASWVFQHYGREATYLTLFVGMFLFSLGNGTCEAVINPLTATLFPRNKTHWLNILHAGWPGGLVLGAMLGLIFSQLNTHWNTQISWQMQIATFLVPTALYGLMMVGRSFPRSEARLSGVTLRRMMQEVGLLGATVAAVLLGYFASDLLGGLNLDEKLHLPHASQILGLALAAALVIVFGSFSQFRIGHWMLAALLILHALVGYVELGTDSWIININETILNNKDKALMLFIWTNVLMFTMRFFAGPIVHRISPLGLLFCSAVLGVCGLLFIGNAPGAWALLAAVTVYGLGKTFFWPTMLGVMSERFPRGGALALGLSGGVGMLSAGLLGGPGIGYKQDYFATKQLQSASSATYERYMARKDTEELKAAGKNPLIYGPPDEKQFLFFPPIAGLDGSKVATLLGDPGKDNGNATKLQADIEAVETKAREGKGPSLDDPRFKSLRDLRDWWEKEGKPNAPKDTQPVSDARLFGGREALIYTAAIPAVMAIGYLLLLLYFRVTGGYRQVHIEEDLAAPTEY
jgi:MFS family permease